MNDRVLSGINVFVSPADAMNARTFSGPTCFKAMSVPVLSLCRIIASRAVRSDTTPVRFGGLNVALSRAQRSHRARAAAG